ncbi:hypothetical protein EJ110_NYTH51138 [Nymphaea thermarum]|nr:hypothetical protein EJ110_NYTH51138 [Nymphaea thermarum]
MDECSTAAADGWIHTVLGHHEGCLSAVGRPRCACAYVCTHRNCQFTDIKENEMYVNEMYGIDVHVLADPEQQGKKRVGPSIEAQREPSSAHSNAHTPCDDSTSGHRYAQLGEGAQTPPRQAPPVDQQTILLTTLQTLTYLVQSMVSNQRGNASPSGDTTAPLKEKASAVSFQQFMAMKPPIFTRGCSHDKAKQWIEEIERIFVLLKMSEEDKVNYGTYLLKGDAMDWWQSTLEIRYAGQPSISWKQFRDSFFNTYYPVHARDKKMQEFLDLQQNQMNLEEYITRYRHLEAYCPHFYTTDGARADKFVHGLRDGLRSKVLMSRPRDFDEAVTMARHIEKTGQEQRRIIIRKQASTHKVGEHRSSANTLRDKAL